jgi:hypothetical protein
MTKTATRETQLQAVQNKFDQALVGLLRSLSFTPVPGAAELDLPHRTLHTYTTDTRLDPRPTPQLPVLSRRLDLVLYSGA